MCFPKTSSKVKHNLHYYTMKPKVLIIGHQWVSSSASAAGTRMLQLIQLCINANFEVCFACAAQKTKYADDFSNLKISEHQINLNDDGFNNWIQNLNPDYVIFDRFISEEQFGWRVTTFSPNSIKILDTEDLHFLRKARHHALKSNTVFSEKNLYSETAYREIAAIYRCDLTLIISSFEMDLLLQTFKIPKDLLWYLPLFAEKPSASKIQSFPNFENRKDVFFIGNFLHEPNWDAVLELKLKIWPLLQKKLPEVKLHIYGAFATQKVTDLHQPKERFLVHGHAESASEVFLRHRLLLAPLRFGAGIKGKLLMAMQNGTPAITSEIGAEGIVTKNIFSGKITNNVQEFVQASALLYYHKSEWLEARKNGFELLDLKFNVKDFEADFILKIKQLKKDIVEHRMRNFLGQMLQHQSLQSTKFMSLWIQEKQKNKSETT